jgi:tetratricopeptide (TPR) repeat protein
LLENSKIAVLYSILNPFFPVRELTGHVSAGGRPWTIYASIEKKGPGKSRVISSGHVALQGTTPDALEEAAAELSYLLIIEAATEKTTRLSEASGTEKKRWRALRALTEGLEAWSETDGLTDALAAEVEEKLDEALDHDPGYPLALYNKGVFYYVEKDGAAANQEAIRLFSAARLAAEDRLTEARGAFGSGADTRLLGLAFLGLARAYSQEVHRYGHLKFGEDQPGEDGISNELERWTRAKDAAAKAVLYLPGDPQAIYAEAFAFHCTVSDGLTEEELAAKKEDLEEGRKRYESLVNTRKLPWGKKRKERFRTVHNNLGYVLLMGGEVRENEARKLEEQGFAKEAGDRRGQARKWWKKAERHMKIVIAVAPPKYKTTAYSYANLGYLRRLQGRFAEAEAAYNNALEAWARARALSPTNAGPEVYVDGLAERARLFAGMGNRVEDALEDHRTALSAEENPRHRFKIARMFLIACDRAGWLDAPESLDSAVEWLSEGDGPDVEEWVGRLRALLLRKSTQEKKSEAA